MFRIRKNVKFSASHKLEGLVEGHPCLNLHGHNYSVDVYLFSKKLDEVGFVIDFEIISQVIKGSYDHVHLNDVMSVNPTAENLAVDIAKKLSDVIFHLEAEREVFIESVAVKETETSEARFYPPQPQE